MDKEKIKIECSDTDTPEKHRENIFKIIMNIPGELYQLIEEVCLFERSLKKENKKDKK